MSVSKPVPLQREQKANQAKAPGGSPFKVPKVPQHPHLRPKQSLGFLGFGKRSMMSEDDDEEEGMGRFEREFDEIGEIGSGEFGKVMKVKRKRTASPSVWRVASEEEAGEEVWAVKKSKRFEGARHR